MVYQVNGMLDTQIEKAPEGKIRVIRSQDVAPILENNARLRNDGNGYDSSCEMVRVASIPCVLIEQWMKEGINFFNPNHWPAVLRKIKDTDFSKLRTSNIKL